MVACRSPTRARGRCAAGRDGTGRRTWPRLQSSSRLESADNGRTREGIGVAWQRCRRPPTVPAVGNASRSELFGRPGERSHPKVSSIGVTEAGKPHFGCDCAYDAGSGSENLTSHCDEGADSHAPRAGWVTASLFALTFLGEHPHRPGRRRGDWRLQPGPKRVAHPGRDGRVHRASKPRRLGPAARGGRSVPLRPRRGGSVRGGAGVTAFTLGMRHAFDADHIAAIDNTTRKLMSEGQKPVSVGFWFALGHSSVVFALVLLLSMGVRALVGQVSNASSVLQTVFGFVGTAVSGFFLIAIGLINLVILLRIVRVYRGVRSGEVGESELEEHLDSRGSCPHPARGVEGDPTATRHVPARSAVRPGIRHRYRDRAARAGGGARRWHCPGTRSWCCRFCSPRA